MIKLLFLYLFFLLTQGNSNLMEIEYLYTPAYLSTAKTLNIPINKKYKTGSDKHVLNKILTLAQDELIDQLNKDQYRFKLTSRWIPARLLQKKAYQIISVELASEINRYTNFKVNYKQGVGAEIVQIQLVVDIEKRLPVAKQRIMYGEILDSNQLDYRWVPISNIQNGLIETKEKLIGKTIRRTLTVGQPIRQADIASEFLINAGDDVTLLYMQNGLEISIKAQARQDGEIDELITLYSNETRTRYLGRVIKPGIVKWEKTL